MHVLDELLAKVTRYDVSIQGGCECCGTWTERDVCTYGEHVSYDELVSLINELKAAAK